MAENFAKAFTPHDKPSSPASIEEIDKMVAKFSVSPFTEDFRQVTGREVKNDFRRTKNNKAPGPDHISNFIPKRLPTRALSCLPNIYNARLELSYFPQQWKKSVAQTFLTEFFVCTRLFFTFASVCLCVSTNAFCYSRASYLTAILNQKS